jgi:two-component system C4-dicarboxylate transport response regulator DctD
MSEKTNILNELSRQKGNKTRTARELGIAKSTLFEKLKKYGIRTPE